MEDFPAAHSMDTCWFAVDGDGNIGYFDSGEGGAVPDVSNALKREAQKIGLGYLGIHSLFRTWSQKNGNRLIHLNIPSEQILKGIGIDPQSYLHIKSIEEIPSKIFPLLKSTSWIDDNAISSYLFPRYSRWSDPHWLFVINRHDFFKIIKNHALRNEDYIIHFLGKPNLFFISHCPISTIEILFNKGCLKYALPLYKHCFFMMNILGFFTYAINNLKPFPYECEGQPIYPLKLSDLPEELQDILTWNWFETIQFSKTSKIQPIEHTRCSTWGSNKWWVDTQGNEREGHPHD